MNKRNRYPYYSNADFQLLELEYSDNNISMLIFLPNDNDLNFLIENLDASKLKESIDSLKVRPGNISIPMFKIKSSYSLLLEDTSIFIQSSILLPIISSLIDSP